MQTLFIEEPIDYTGLQLQPHYIFNKYQLVGNALIAFKGKAVVPLENMVDQEDVVNKEAIYSENMLHFIGEYFENDLFNAVYRQRFYMAIILENLPDGFQRHGDDLYYGDKKLSVSIATASPVSTLIHIGLNISSKNTPVKTIGLEDLNIDTDDFARGLLQKITADEQGILKARCKVRGVY